MAPSSGIDADAAALDAGAPRPRVPAASHRTDPDSLLDAIRRALQPVDPVARLLALWPAPPVRAVGHPSRAGGGAPAT